MKLGSAQPVVRPMPEFAAPRLIPSCENACHEAVAHLREGFAMRERRACPVVGADRSSLRYGGGPMTACLGTLKTLAGHHRRKSCSSISTGSAEFPHGAPVRSGVGARLKCHRVCKVEMTPPSALSGPVPAPGMADFRHVTKCRAGSGGDLSSFRSAASCRSWCISRFRNPRSAISTLHKGVI